MSAAANIFVGQTEAPLVVRPFVPKMTQSELFAVMCGGLASIAGGVLAGYASMGVKIEYLVAASFMAAPGGLLFAKLMMPETENHKTMKTLLLMVVTTNRLTLSMRLLAVLLLVCNLL